MDTRPWTEFERLTYQETALRRRLMTAILDNDSDEVLRTRAEIKHLEVCRAEALARVGSSFDVVA